MAVQLSGAELNHLHLSIFYLRLYTDISQRADEQNVRTLAHTIRVSAGGPHASGKRRRHTSACVVMVRAIRAPFHRDRAAYVAYTGYQSSSRFPYGYQPGKSTQAVHLRCFVDKRINI